jgi:hypothetical protein
MSNTVYTELSNLEKSDILKANIRSLEYSLFGLEISEKVNNALETPDEYTAETLSSAISEKKAQIAALKSDLDLITEE